MLYLLKKEKDLARFDPLIHAITKISSIKVLDLFMPLDGRWYRHFHHLVNLKQLNWVVKDEYFLNCSSHALGLPKDEHHRLQPIEDFATRVFSEVFENFLASPRIRFCFLPKSHYNKFFDEDNAVDLGDDRAWGPNSYVYEFWDDYYSDYWPDDEWNGEGDDTEEGDEDDDSDEKQERQTGIRAPRLELQWKCDSAAQTEPLQMYKTIL